ncbi:MAG: type II toxin-antitoxin system prevent-host-death family antitoxin [Candidatus Korobacteraceae bacterium]
MSYTVHQAKTNLSRLIKEAESGKEVVITRGKKPVVKLLAVNQSEKKKRVPGRLKDLISWEPDAFAPLTDEELRDWGLL